MKVTFATTTLLSFYQWMDNYLLQNAQAYTNYSSQFFYQPDPTLGPGYIAFASPFKSFVWDSGVSGAAIFNGISGAFGTLNRGQSGVMTDFINGRVIIPSTLLSQNAVVSGSYSFKDFNIYFANQTQEKMVFTDKYYLNPRFNNSATGAPPIQWNEKTLAYNMVTPCIFLSNVGQENPERAIGGLFDTTMQIKANVMAEDMGQLEGAMSYFADSLNAVFPHLHTNVWPLNSYGDYKSGYNYQTVLEQYNTAANQFMITKVQSFKLSDSVKIDEGVFLGEIVFTVSKPRYL